MGENEASMSMIPKYPRVPRQDGPFLVINARMTDSAVMTRPGAKTITTFSATAPAISTLPEVKKSEVMTASI